MKLVHSATFGVALALGAASAHAQGVVTRQIDNEPVETTVTRTPTETVVPGSSPNIALRDAARPEELGARLAIAGLAPHSE